MLWEVIYWEAMHPAIHVDITLTNKHCSRVCTSQTVFSDIYGLFQHDNALSHFNKFTEVV